MNSIYIHIPFCSSICSYCDFAKIYYNKKFAMDYLKELEKEIKNNYNNDVLKTIYIGGGTPSSLDLEELEYLFNILDSLIKDTNYEYTIECNVENLTEEKIKLFKKYGINRVSIGVQTFNEKYLKFLNRHHSRDDVINIINLLKKYNINNINVDLIYALPGQTLEELDADLEEIIKLDIPHISTYSLIIEPNTILYNNEVTNIDEELDYKMYENIINKLNNYNHYEVSNFAKPGYESKHNLTYWNNNEYYGFGVGASGYINGIRYDNTRSINNYLKGTRMVNKEYIDFNTKLENEFILGFRKISGINKKEFYDKYHFEIKNIEIINELIKKGLLTETDDNIYIKNIYTSNNVLVEFLGVNYEKYNI